MIDHYAAAIAGYAVIVTVAAAIVLTKFAIWTAALIKPRKAKR
jgi:hypothetical protein